MSVIEVKDLTKVFKIPKKEPGLGGAVKGLFRPQYLNKVAVNAINFKLEAGESVGYIGVNGAVKGLFRPQYLNKVAVNAINFKLEAGEIVGYIGVNGAGKSTTIKMLTRV